MTIDQHRTARSTAGRIGANAALGLVCGALTLVAADRSALGDASTRPEPQQGQGGQKASTPFLSFYSAGADSFLRSPKDRWLLDAVRQIEKDGIQFPPEIQRELDRDPEGRMVMSLLGQILTSRVAGSFAITAPEGGGPPMPEGQVSFLGNDRRGGDALEPTLIDAMQRSGVWGQFRPDPANASFKSMQPPDGPKIWFGTQKQGKGSATVVSVGRPPSAEPMNFERFGLSPGVEPQVAFELDFGPLQPYLGMASTMLPQGPDGRGLLEQMGLVSNTPMVFRAAATNDGNEGRVDVRLVNAVKAMSVTDAQKALVLEASDLQWLPADSVNAWVGKMDLRDTITAFVDQYNAQAEAFGLDDESDFEGDEGGMHGDDDGMGGDHDGMHGDDDGMGGGPRHAQDGAAASEGAADRWVHRHLGLDLRRDLLAPLGTTVASHSSESLGGGILGTAVVITLRDPETMQRSLARLAELLNKMPEPRQHGFGMRARSQPGVDALYSLSFAGLPIPLQASVGIGHGALVVGLTPQTVIAALAQAKAKSSIADHPNFKAMKGAELVKGANSLGWFDAPWTVRNAYGVLLALGNSVDGTLLPQSGAPTPFAASVPTLGELTRGAKPSICVGRVDGDDFAWTYRCDGSFSVQLTAMCAYLSSGSTATTAFAVGLLLPALSKAREAAREAKMEAARAHEHAEPVGGHAQGGAGDGGGFNVQTATKLREVGMACHSFAADNRDRFPDGFLVLVEKGYLSATPINPRRAPGLTGQFVLKPPSESVMRVKAPERTPLAWEEFDRWPRGGICVLFVDGHVSMVAEEDEFDLMLAP